MEPNYPQEAMSQELIDTISRLIYWRGEAMRLQKALDEASQNVCSKD